jgi:hypothetical protein
VKFALGLAIAAASSRTTFARVAELLRARAEGPARMALLFALKRAPLKERHDLMQQLSMDPDLADEVQRRLKQRRHRRATR